MRVENVEEVHSLDWPDHHVGVWNEEEKSSVVLKKLHHHLYGELWVRWHVRFLDLIHVVESFLAIQEALRNITRHDFFDGR